METLLVELEVLTLVVGVVGVLTIIQTMVAVLAVPVLL
jgi:hypothetical protein